MATLTLSVTLLKKYDEAVVTIDPSALTGKKGYVVVSLTSLATVVKDIPTDGLPYNYTPTYIGPNGDQVPRFTVKNSPNGGDYGSEHNIIQHPLSKLPGTKTYVDKLFVFAVNDGKLDANASTRPSNNGTTGTNTNLLIRAILEKLPEWPCDDDVTATLTFTKTESLNA